MLTNIVVTLLVALMAIGLPLADRKVCRKLNLHPDLPRGNDPGHDRLLHLRLLVLWAVFAVYAAILAYLVFFSRAASEEYKVHVELMQDLRNAVSFDTSYIGVIDTILEKGLAEGLSLIHIEKAADISQVYLNIALFIPFGYLLPYCSARFRTKTIRRTVLTGFIVSFLIENLQLVFKRGYYDADDLLSNTVGAFFGVLLYLLFAYAISHPDWRKELRNRRRWNRFVTANKIYPLPGRADISCVTLYASDEKKIDLFFTHKMGFRPVRRAKSEDGTILLLYSTGPMLLEVVCCGPGSSIPPQTITLTAGSAERLHRKMLDRGIAVSGFLMDENLSRRCFTVAGPDGLTVRIIG